MEEELENITNDIEKFKLNDLNQKKIESLKREVLTTLFKEKSIIDDLLIRFKEYRYIDELDEIIVGRFIRYFKFNKEKNIYMSNGGFIVNVLFENNNMNLLCKNTSNNFFKVKWNETIVFQMLSSQEQLLVSILDELY